jgi:hemerythrin-like domain-containing protein
VYRGSIQDVRERGQVRNGNFMKCTDLLIQDHKLILRSLDILDEIAAKVDKLERVATSDIEALLHFLRVFGDDNHQAKEESALFPVLMLTQEAQHGPLNHMQFEHDQERSLVEGIAEALKTNKGPDFVHFANRLCSLLRNHIYKEEHILFEIVEGSLSPEQDEQVVGEFERFDIAAGNRQELLYSLRRLEWIYMGRAA